MATGADQKLLFIGNSYTGRNDLPGILALLAASAPTPRVLETRAVLMNGMSLRAHWNRGDAVAMIREWRPDQVVLQEQSTLPLKNAARMRDSIRLLDEEIRKAGGRTVLYMTWARRDARDRQGEIAAAYEAAGRETRALVAPVGLAWDMVLKRHPELLLHEADGSHPTPAGTYLAACVFFGALLDQSPVGLPAASVSIPPDTCRVLQSAAWEVLKT